MFIILYAAVDDDGDAVTLDRRCSAGETNPARKRRFAAVSDGEMEESDADGLEEGAGAELTSGDLSFKPLFMISNWTERSTLAKRLSVAIILPSGIGTGDFSINVVDGGQYLQLAVRWPQPLLDVLVMHRWKLTDSDSTFMPYHPSVLGFEATLSELRSRNSDVVESVARIPLPFAVQTQIVSKANLAFREGGGTKMLYVDLKAFVLEEYAVVADTEDFKVV